MLAQVRAETGDRFKFTGVLAQRAADLGTRFVHGSTIRTLAVGGPRVTGVVTDQGEEPADAIVVALSAIRRRLCDHSGSGCRSIRSRAIP